MREIFIDDAPSLIELPASLVSSTTGGHPEYDDLVVIWVTPAETNQIPSKANYIVNPERIEEGEWSASDFTYSVVGETSTITGFTNSGAGKVLGGVFPVVFPEKDDAGNIIVAIVNGAFSSAGVKEADFSQMSGLKTIGASAFANNGIESFDLSNLTQLEVIDTSAFAGNRITELDFTTNGALRQINDSAFANNSLVTVDLTGAEKLGE